jgi:hypothetical protein
MNARWIRLTGLLAVSAAALLCNIPTFAQDTVQTGTQSDPASPASSAPAKRPFDQAPVDPVTGSSNEPSRQYVVIGTDRLISVDPMLKYQWLYGLDLTEGYDDGLILFPEQKGVYYTLATPRIGVLGRTPKSQYIVQYSPTLSYFNNAGPTGIQAYQQGSAELHTDVNRTWGYDVILNAEYGTYPLSLLSDFSFQSLDGVTAVDPNSILLLTSQDYLNTSASIGGHWHITPRDNLTVSTIYNYANFQPNNVPGSIAGHIHREEFTATYTRNVTRRFNILANGNAQHVFGTFACTTYGVQVGASYELVRGTTLSGTAGPQFGTGTCSESVTMDYSAHLTTRLSRTWDAYLSAERTSTGAIHSVAGSGVTETYGGGISKQLAERINARLDTGYIHVSSVAGVPSSFSANGWFVSPQVAWVFSRSVELNFRYSRIYQVVSGFDLDRNQGMVTLQWRPTSRGAN